MFLGKLWVRLRGELLTLRDDLLGEGEIRGKAREFLQKLEDSLDAPDFRADPRKDPLTRLDAVTKRMEELERAENSLRDPADPDERTERLSVHELEEAWEELKRSRKNPKHNTQDRKDPPPNPRTLG